MFMKEDFQGVEGAAVETPLPRESGGSGGSGG